MFLSRSLIGATLLENLYRLTKNKEDTMWYVLLGVGVLLLIFNAYFYQPGKEKHILAEC